MQEDTIKDACFKIVSKRIMSEHVENVYKRYDEDNRYKYISSSFSGKFISSFSTPMIIAKLFNNRLNKITVFNQGLVKILGGNIKGYNMLIGIMIFAIGSIISYDTFAYFHNKNIYSNFLKEKLHSTFDDKIILDDLTLHLKFKISNNDIFIDGPAKVHQNETLLYEGNIKCDGIICELDT